MAWRCLRRRRSGGPDEAHCRRQGPRDGRSDDQCAFVLPDKYSAFGQAPSASRVSPKSARTPSLHVTSHAAFVRATSARTRVRPSSHQRMVHRLFVAARLTTTFRIYGGSNHCVRKKGRVRCQGGADWHIDPACSVPCSGSNWCCSSSICMLMQHVREPDNCVRNCATSLSMRKTAGAARARSDGVGGNTASAREGA